MSRQNPYIGVDAHLNSWLQRQGTMDDPSMWPTFHAVFISFLTNALDAQLPEQYVAFEERSLQQRFLDAEGGVKISRRVPDIAIFQNQLAPQSAQPGAAAVAVTTPTWEGVIDEDIEPEVWMRALVIRRLDGGPTKLGTVVTRIEVLSPANKPGSAHYPTYQANRIETFKAHTPLIEIDLLHEQEPVISRAPRYPEHPNGRPFYIAVSDPRPSIAAGKARVYGFSVGQKLPKIAIPLADDETLPFDFDEPYQQTVQARRWQRYVDYAQEPLNFGLYRADDQAAIRSVIAQFSSA